MERVVAVDAICSMICFEVGVFVNRKLYRSRTNRMIFGVCGGLGEYLDVDPTIIRVAFVVLALMSGIGILAYLVMAVLIPLQGSQAGEPKESGETIQKTVEEMKRSATELGQEVRSTFTKEEKPEKGQGWKLVGVFLIVLGGLFLWANFGPLWWPDWQRFWPLILIAAGLVLLLSPKRKHA
jgi:phage shock protein PspC (stress-responsive transcriptional regulator)